MFEVIIFGIVSAAILTIICVITIALGWSICKPTLKGVVLSLLMGLLPLYLLLCVTGLLGEGKEVSASKNISKKISSIIVQALDELNVSYESLAKDCYKANVEKSCGVFHPMITYSSVDSSFHVFVPYVTTIPKQAIEAISAELICLNNFSENVEVSTEDNDDGETDYLIQTANWELMISFHKDNVGRYTMFSSIHSEFEEMPTSEEIRELISKPIDLMSNENITSIVNQ